MTHFDLTGRVAIVTGGNSGIGLGMARGLVGAGAAIVITGRNKAKNLAAAKELETLGTNVAALEVEVTSEAALQAMVNEVVERFGRLDILINNAGTNIRKPPQDYTLTEWHTILETNLTSAFM